MSSDLKQSLDATSLRSSPLHRRSKTISHLDSSRRHGITTADDRHSPRSLASPLLSSVQLPDDPFSPAAHRSRARSRAQRPPMSSGAGTQPPQSPSRKIAERLGSPPLSPIGSRSGLSRVLNLEEDEEEHIGSGGPRPRTLIRSNNSSLHFPIEDRGPSVSDAYPRASHGTSAVKAETQLSRSTSLRNDRAERAHYEMLLPSRGQTFASSPEGLPHSLSSPVNGKDWSTRARRWSSSMSRMSISAINETISSTTSPYLKAGLDELRSIFDVDSIGLYDESDGRHRLAARDLEGCSVANDGNSSQDEEDDTSSRGESSSSHGLGLYGRSSGRGHANTLLFPKRCNLEAMFDSSNSISGRSSRSLTRQSTMAKPQQVERRGAAARRSTVSGALETATTSDQNLDSTRMRISTGVGSPGDLAERDAVASARTDEGNGSRGLNPTRTPKAALGSMFASPAATAVGLAAIAVGLVTLCSLEASIHPDAASFPLIAFMLSQPLFAVSGLIGLLLQKRWLMDLSSRLLRAHVLCQVLIALAALRNLSQSAIYHRATQKHGSFDVKSELVSGLRFSRFDRVDSGGRRPRAPYNPATTPHQSNVGSFRDQVTYLLVFSVQAALPLLAVLWTQYRIAMRLSSLATKSGSQSLASEVGAPSEASGRSEEKPSRQPRASSVRRGSNRSNSHHAGASVPTAPTADGQQPEWTGTEEKARLLGLQLESAPDPTPILDFQLDVADLSSRLERVRRESLQAEARLQGVSQALAAA